MKGLEHAVNGHSNSHGGHISQALQRDAGKPHQSAAAAKAAAINGHLEAVTYKWEY